MRCTAAWDVERCPLARVGFLHWCQLTQEAAIKSDWSALSVTYGRFIQLTFDSFAKRASPFQTSSMSPFPRCTREINPPDMANVPSGQSGYLLFQARKGNSLVPLFCTCHLLILHTLNNQGIYSHTLARI